MHRLIALVVVLAACTREEPSRAQRVVDILAEDNYVTAQRDPELVAMKLRKMQRGPYEWLRGTVAVYWRDVMEPGAPRASTQFGDAASSRVLLVGDPHVENIGTYRASDGTMFIDWNDFDATGYGPYGGDLRRLGASFALVSELGAPGDAAFAGELVRLVAEAYAARIAELANGARIGTLGVGASELFDKELDKAQTRGDALFAVDELAPATNGVRALAFGDLEAVAPDGVIEDRVVGVDAEQADWIDRAIDSVGGRRAIAQHGSNFGAIKLRARRIGSGVSSYAVYRFNVVLEGATDSPDDDVVLELKETREGVIVRGVPQLESAEWPTPAVRAVDTQQRLHARPDGDVRLGAAQVGGLSLKVRDREAYQRGIDAPDLVELAAGNAGERDRLRELSRLYGGLLARAHGQALTADRVPGHTVIAPLLAGREAAFADEIVALSLADAATVIADHATLKDEDLASFVLPKGR